MQCKTRQGVWAVGFSVAIWTNVEQTSRLGLATRQLDEDVVRIGCAMDSDSTEFGGIDFHGRPQGSMAIAWDMAMLRWL